MRQRFVPFVVTFWLCSAASGYSSSSDLTDLSIEELSRMRVYAASRFDQPLTEAPSAVTVITHEDIRDHGWRTLGDILNSIGGLYTTYDRGYAYLGIRGFGRPGDYNTRVLLMVDGIRVNDSLFGSATIDSPFPLDVELIDRVEFVPGPGSAVYGSNALFGVVSVTTRHGGNMGKEIAAGMGNQGYQKGRASLGGTFAGGGDWLLSASHWQQDGETLRFPAYARINGGVAQGLDGETGQRLFLRAGQGPLTFTLIHGQRDKDLPAAPYGTDFGDPRTRVQDHLTLADLRLTGYFRDWEFTSRLFYGNSQENGFYSIAGIVNQDRLHGRWDGAEFRLTGNTGPYHHWVMGAEYQHDLHNLQENFDIDPYVLYLRHISSQDRYGLYLQDEITLSPQLRFNAGLRYDLYTSFGNILNPRLALLYRASDLTTWKLLYGSAYRAPSDEERFYAADTPGGNLPNPNLGPERIRTYELVWEHNPTRQFRHLASLFYYRAQDLIEANYDQTIQRYINQNTTSSEAAGLEYSLAVTADNGWRGRGSLTWQYARDYSSHEWLTNSPRLLGKLTVSAPFLLPNWRLGSELLFTSSRRNNDDKSAAATVANLVIRGEALQPGLELSIGLYNLFNSHYADPTSNIYSSYGVAEMPREGRTLLTQMLYRF